MDRQQADIYLNSLKKFGVRLRLEHIERLLELLGNPQDGLKCIHVAGTNGKGSVCACLNSIFIESGFKTGLYTSPHFYRLNERIRVDDKVISDRDLARITGVVKPLADKVSRELGDMTFFEVTTAIALLYFAERKVDFVVLETGLGGRLDATNVVTPLISVITSISKDHTKLLGSRIEDIAAEKAAIIKKDGLVVTACSGRALEVIEKACREKNAVLCVVGDEVFVEKRKSSLREQSVSISFFGRHFKIRIRLLGIYQSLNAAVALSVVEMLKTFFHIDFSNKSVLNGFKKAFMPCRLELVQTNPIVFLDGAHNPDGVEKLTNSLNEITTGRITLVFGCSKGKDYRNMISTISKKVKSVFVCKTALADAENPKKLFSEFKKRVIDVTLGSDVKTSVIKALKKSGKNDIIVVTGSLYVAGEARLLWHKKI